MTAREKLLPLLEEKGADCALLLDEVSIRWLTRFAASDGAAVVDRTGVRLLVDPRYYAAAKDAAAARLLPLMFIPSRSPAGCSPRWRPSRTGRCWSIPDG